MRRVRSRGDGSRDCARAQTTALIDRHKNKIWELHDATFPAGHRLHAGDCVVCAWASVLADVANFVAAGSGRAGSCHLDHLCRPHRVRRPVRQAVRHRREAEHRSTASYRLRMGRRQDAGDPPASRREVPGWRGTGRGGGEIHAGPLPDDAGQLPQKRDQFDRPCGGGGPRNCARRAEELRPAHSWHS